MASKKKPIKKVRSVKSKTKRKSLGPIKVPSKINVKDPKVRQATEEVFEHYNTMISSGDALYNVQDHFSSLRGFVGGICAMSKVRCLNLTDRQVQELFKNLMVLVTKLAEYEHERRRFD